MTTNNSINNDDRFEQQKIEGTAWLLKETIDNISKVSWFHDTALTRYDFKKLALQTFENEYGFKPEAGKIKDKEIKKSPKERIDIIFKESEQSYMWDTQIENLKYEDEQAKKAGIDISTNKEAIEREKEWSELAQEMEQHEIEALTKKMDEIIIYLRDDTKYVYNDMKKMAMDTVCHLLDSGCEIKGMKFSTNHQLKIVQQDDEVKRLSNATQDDIKNGTRLYVQPVEIDAQKFNTMNFNIQIKDHANSSTGKRFDISINANADHERMTNQIIFGIENKRVETNKIESESLGR